MLTIHLHYKNYQTWLWIDGDLVRGRAPGCWLPKQFLRWAHAHEETVPR